MTRIVENYKESNEEFASRYLANATSLPAGEVWARDEDLSIDELEAMVAEVADAEWKLIRGWDGGRRAARKIFEEGWRVGGNDDRAIAYPDADRLTLRFRTSYQRELRRGRLGLRVRTESDRLFPAGVAVDGQSIPEVDLSEYVLPLPSAPEGNDGSHFIEIAARSPNHRPPVVALDIDELG